MGPPGLVTLIRVNIEEQTKAIAERDGRISELEARLAECDEITALLTDAEQRLARVPELELRIADLEHELTEARRAADAADLQARALDEQLMCSQRVLLDVFNSPSWQLTKPLRSARRLLRS